MWHLGTWVSEGLGSAALVLGLNDFMGLFQPKLRFHALPAWHQKPLPLGWIIPPHIPLPVSLFPSSGCQKHQPFIGVRGGWGEGKELPCSPGSFPQPPSSFSFYLFIYLFWCKPPASALCLEPAYSSKKHLYYSQAIW